MASEVVTSWGRLVKQLQEAGVANQRVTEAMSGVTCCQPEIGMTPGGVPFNLHEPSCRGLEERLAAAVFTVPTDTEVEMEHLEDRIVVLTRARSELLSRLRQLVANWHGREHNPRHNRSEAYQLGETNAWGAAAAQLAEELNNNYPDGSR